MKILFINRVIGFWRGGGESFDMNLARRLKSQNYEVEFLAGCDRNGHVPIPVDVFPTTYIYSPYLDPFVSKIPFRIKGLGKLWLLDKYLWGKRAIKCLNKWNEFSGVFVNGIPSLGSYIASHFKIPTIVMFHGPPDRVWYPFIRNAEYIPASLGASFEVIKRLNPNSLNLEYGVEGEIPINREGRRELKGRYGIPLEAPVILYVGRLVKIKNIAMILRSFKLVLTDYPNALLFLVGEGDERIKLMNLVRYLGIQDQVIFVGRVSHEQISDYYRVADIFVLSSEFDNFPTVLVEAMFHELPIVATNVGGIPLQIKSGVNGVLVEKNNVSAFASSIVLLLKNEELRREIAIRNRVMTMGRYNWDKTVHQVISSFCKGNNSMRCA